MRAGRADLGRGGAEPAIARLRRAEARLKALAHEPNEDLFDNANSVFNHALKKMVRTPAPDLPALSLNIDLAALRLLNLYSDLDRAYLDRRIREETLGDHGVEDIEG